MEDFLSECPICGGRERMTGRREMREGRRYYEFRCTACASIGWEWHRELDDREDPQNMQRIYERGVYAGIVILLWFVLFPIKHPVADMIISSCISLCFMAIYVPLLHKFQNMLARHIASLHARAILVFAITLVYESAPLWAFRGRIPLWGVIILGVMMTSYYAYAVFRSQIIGTQVIRR